MPTEIKIVVVTAFEPDDASPIPGEIRRWREGLGLTEVLPFPAGYQSLSMNADGVLGIVTGMGSVRAAASIMALGMDPRFDLSRAFWLVSGVAGVDPARTSLGSVVLPEWVVDGNLAHEIDPREVPAGWPDGLVAIGKTIPYELPRAARFGGDDGIVFRLDSGLVGWAFELVQDVELMDRANMAARRGQFEPAETAGLAPHVVRGDELSSATFWHGELLGERARRWVEYQTEGRGDYCVTAMEDTGTLQSLRFLAAAGRVDFARVLIARAASNYDRQRPGISAAESLVETNVTTYSAYLPALENAYRVGSRIVAGLLAGWPASPSEGKS